MVLYSVTLQRSMDVYRDAGRIPCVQVRERRLAFCGSWLTASRRLGRGCSPTVVTRAYQMPSVLRALGSMARWEGACAYAYCPMAEHTGSLWA